MWSSVGVGVEVEVLRAKWEKVGLLPCSCWALSTGSICQPLRGSPESKHTHTFSHQTTARSLLGHEIKHTYLYHALRAVVASPAGGACRAACRGWSQEESASSSSSGPYVVDFGLGVDVYFILSVVVARHQHCIVGRILDCCCGRTPLPCICLGGLRIDFTFGLSSSFCVCRSPWVGRPGGCVGDLTSFAGDCPFRLSQKAERDECGARGIVWMISG